MEKKQARMEKVFRMRVYGSRGGVSCDVIMSEKSQVLVIPSKARDLGFSRSRRKPRFLVAFASRNDNDKDWLGHLYAIFRSTRDEFFDPNPTQLQMACSI